MWAIFYQARRQEGDHGDENPSLSSTEEKLKTTKIITANNTADRRTISKFHFEYKHPSDYPSRISASLHAQICTKYCTKAFVGRDLPGAAGGAYSAPQTPYLD